LKAVRELVHGTCVALGEHAALLRGKPGSGKSDLALRFMALPAEGKLKPLLVADDQVVIEARASGTLRASAPPTIAGKIEVRGLGIVEVPYLPEARLVLVCDLVEAKDVPRMPLDRPEQAVIAGIALPILRLAPLEASAPLKLKMALILAASGNPH
jgi:serine kinase of HPr protein (carbohydrate metabolism regulator)